MSWTIKEAEELGLQLSAFQFFAMSPKGPWCINGVRVWIDLILEKIVQYGPERNDQCDFPKFESLRHCVAWLRLHE